jgi:hypothetical protein
MCSNHDCSNDRTVLQQVVPALKQVQDKTTAELGLALFMKPGSTLSKAHACFDI